MEVEGNIIPWLLYSVKIVMALAVIVAGTSSQGDAWGNARYIVYHMYPSRILWQDDNAKRTQILRCLGFIHLVVRLVESGTNDKIHTVKRQALYLNSQLADTL